MHINHKYVLMIIDQLVICKFTKARLNKDSNLYFKKIDFLELIDISMYKQ
jgi:hypothetical protein